MSGITIRGKALWIVPVVALIGAVGTGCTIRDAHNVEHSASARPVRMSPAAPAGDRVTGDGPAVASAQQ